MAFLRRGEGKRVKYNKLEKFPIKNFDGRISFEKNQLWKK
jgi:hypothetical protein